MKKMKKGLCMLLLTLFAVLTLPSNTKAMSLVSEDSKAVTDSKASVITASKTAVTITKGKTATITVSFQPGQPAMLSAKASNSRVSMAWSGWSLKQNKLVIKGVSAGTSTITLKNTYNSQTCTIKVTVKDPVIYRAAIIGQYDYKTNNDLPACKNDALAMTRTCKRAGYSTVNTVYNASAQGIKNAITTAFKGADSNDVSLFYYSGHGASNGALCSIESYGDSLLYISQLASWLKQVPGTVIVLFDSCFSGMSINKSANGTITTSFDDSVTKKDIDNFNSSVVSAFSKADTEVKAATKSGELCSSKFKVITACSKSEYSWCSSQYSYFTYCVVEGAGINYSTGANNGSIYADTDGNKIITVNECWQFAKYQTSSFQSAQVYPSNCSTRMFKR